MGRKTAEAEDKYNRKYPWGRAQDIKGALIFLAPIVLVSAFIWYYIMYKSESPSLAAMRERIPAAQAYFQDNRAWFETESAGTGGDVYSYLFDSTGSLPFEYSLYIVCDEDGVLSSGRGRHIHPLEGFWVICIEMNPPG